MKCKSYRRAWQKLEAHTLEWSSLTEYSLKSFSQQSAYGAQVEDDVEEVVLVGEEVVAVEEKDEKVEEEVEEEEEEEDSSSSSTNSSCCDTWQIGISSILHTHTHRLVLKSDTTKGSWSQQNLRNRSDLFLRDDVNCNDWLAAGSSAPDATVGSHTAGDSLDLL